MTEAEIAILVVTSVLVVVALWYAAETRRIVNRMDRQLEATTKPILVFSVIPWQARAVKLRIANAGPGPAHEIEGLVEASGDGAHEKFKWSYPVLMPGKYEEFGFPSAPGASSEERFRIDKITGRFSLVRADLSYSSGSGRKYSLQQSIDVSRLTSDWIESRMMATQDHPERLTPRIAKALESIASTLTRQERRADIEYLPSTNGGGTLRRLTSSLAEIVSRFGGSRTKPR